MHELGVLYQALRSVERIAERNNILRVKHVTLEVGEESDCVPAFFEKLFPVAVEKFPVAQGAELRIERAPGNRLTIKDIGY